MSETLSISLPEYDQLKLDGIIGELSQYVIEVPADPATVGGFEGINRLFAQLHGYQTRVQEIVSHAIKWHSTASAVYNIRKHAYEAKKVAMLAAKRQDDYQSYKALEAEVENALLDEVREMQRAKLIASLFGSFLEIVEGKQSNLESAKKTLENVNNNWKRQNPLPPPVLKGSVVNP